MRVIDVTVSDPKNYVYAISDTEELLNAVSAGYARRYGVAIDPKRRSLSAGSQEGLAHIA
jgi:LL-diaminopimelate aminotransferase